MYSETIEKALKSAGIAIGDHVRLTTQKKKFEGVLMPRPEYGKNEIVVLKLSNGYNIGIEFKKESKIERIAKGEPFLFPKSNLSFKNSLKNISLIYTGGTIGSKVDYLTGGVHVLTKPEELLYEVPELAKIANIKVNKLMSIWSEDMSYLEWQSIAKNAAEALNGGADGVVITHGTDTMHYTSAALSFMLSGLNRPVVITGAQRSSDRGSSDAFMNLICAANIAANSDIAEVGICMHADSSDTKCNFIRGTKARKMHSSKRDAFKPINSRPIAAVDYNGNIEYKNSYNKIESGSKKRVKLMIGYEPKIAMVKAYPNSDPGIFDYYTKKGYRGIIIEGTGLGHAPISTKHSEYNWLNAIKDAAASDIIIGVAPQTLYGRVDGNVYSTGRIMSNLGVVYCEDMLPEVAYVKLGFLLGNYKRNEAKALLGNNIAGEITERSEIE